MLIKEATERRYVVMIASLLHPLLSDIVRICIIDHSKMGGIPALSHFQIPGFNSFAPGKIEWHFRYVIFEHIVVIDGWGPNMNVTGLHWWSVNIDSGNGLVPSGNRPLPEPMLTQVSLAIWCH